MRGAGVVRGAAIASMVASMAGCGSGVNGLRAVTTNEPAGTPAWTVVVDSSEPVLRWQAFPREADERVFGPRARERITNVRYDLKLWPPGSAGTWCAAPTVVEGLARPEYRLGSSGIGQTFRWAARASFDLDGKPRVTQWTGIGSRPSVWDSPVDHPMVKVEDRGGAKSGGKVAGV